MENAKMNEPKRASEVEGEIGCLSKELETLSIHIEKLEAILGNVLRQPEDEKLKASVTERRTLVPLADQIRCRCELVSSLSDKVADIISRLGN